jgi:glutamate synthase (ferredoxin)
MTNVNSDCLGEFHHPVAEKEQAGFKGQPWLVEERDACGVGFVASQRGIASHRIVEQALQGLTCVEHRGGCSADQASGDGAGVMTQIPWTLIQQWLESTGQSAEPEALAVGMVFLPTDATALGAATALADRLAAAEGFAALGWRSVPVNPSVLGPQARENLPTIQQWVLRDLQFRDGDGQRPVGDHRKEQRLYLLRKRLESALRAKVTEGEAWAAQMYLCSLSGRTIVYKGMVQSVVLAQFYGDLQNPDYVSAFALYHRRFSTNTMPKWPLAQPMRFLGHNGEINTLLGNINWMTARESTLAHEVWGDGQRPAFGHRISTLHPIVNPNNSDSANLDNVLELLVQSGRSPLEAAMILVPEAYQNQPALANHPEIVDFYEFYSGLQESWDGPALLAFSDGKVVGATLDRNGLRPARYCVTQDDHIYVASEAGGIALPEENIIAKGRLGPGQMIAVNLETHEVLTNWEIKQRIAQTHPYGAWLKRRQELGGGATFAEAPTGTAADCVQQQTAFGYSAEDVEMILHTMAQEGKEPTFCMGDDIPLAILSAKPHVLYDYFKQRFAQVTNPAIDPLREKLVMSLGMSLGAKGNLLNPQASDAQQIRLGSPILNSTELDQLRQSILPTATLSTWVAIAAGPEGLEAAVLALQTAAAAAVRQGAQILILSDRQSPTGELALLNADHSFIPPLLAVGAVHHGLIRAGLRMQASLVVDTAQCWSTHHLACLIGYGASAVCPYLAFETACHWWQDDKTQSLMARGRIAQMTLIQAQANVRSALEAGLLKILSKMGISLLASYQGAQIFEAIGIGPELLALGFTGTVSRVGGLRVSDLAQETLQFHQRAFPSSQRKLENFGFIQFRPTGEYHMNNPALAKALHQAVNTPNPDHYTLYQQQLKTRPATALRDLLEFKSDRPSIPLSQVESAAEIMTRFCTGGMSLGALSREAHEVLAIAMNRIGGKSNSGEGGEDEVRFQALNDVDEQGQSPTLPHLQGLQNGDTACSAIKQIASGRFGVTPAYLMSGEQLEIKVAQGAKPGEGGQLPGTKVSPYIAALRRSKPGVTLISPPPHHDIYSIEDLAQLIFDLHQINPKAKVSVKLVAEIGIGTIAAGVAKANADIIQISGHDGGTGASPLSSIKHAGTPWELGLTEVHRVLMENQLRDRVTLRVDGGLKTGWDIVMAALMGAEEYGFGSIAMIAEGCIMARICHTNNCPVGVATQKEELRLKFKGIPEHVVNFMAFIAEEVRSILAHLGYARLDELMGRADLLAVRPEVTLAKTKALSLACLTQLPDTRSDRQWLQHGPVHSNGPVLDDQILENPAIQSAIALQSQASFRGPIVNTDRTVGTRIAGAIAQKYGDQGFQGQITLSFQGSAGQSFGAFILPGMTLQLQGEANDYVGKGMHGGEIIIQPNAQAKFEAAGNVIIGNTCLYGATGGLLLANGTAGERFAVRNSLAQAVVEGTGDHCCEYMTGGVVVVLGTTGRNFGAGMTGGLAYVLDEVGDFLPKLNPEILQAQRVITPEGETQLQALIQLHAQRTGSVRAQTILAHWSEFLPQFWQLVPPSECDRPEVTALEVTAEQTSLVTA